MKTTLLALAVFGLMVGSAMAAGPYLVTDPQPGADYFVVAGLPAVINASNCTPDPAGTYGLKLDLSALPPGSYTVTAQACNAVWGCSPNSVPFAFTRPNSGQAPTGLGFSVK